MHSARYAGLRANYSYAVETRTDADLFSLQTVCTCEKCIAVGC